MKLHPVILAGGSGSRLWPLSRELYPKPFLPITGARTMLQETILRLDGIDGAAPPVVVCNEEHRFLVAEQSRRIERMPESIMLESVGRNTAPALTLAALALEYDPDDPILLVFPADHAIGDLDAFHSAVSVAIEQARQGCVATFGITPDSPSVAYGYIRKGAPRSDGGGIELAEFVEKPDLPTARRMVDSGNYLWNSGMFVLRTSAWLEEMERFRPDIVKACRKARAGGAEDGIFYRPDADAFAACPADTIDYAVMERIVGANAERGKNSRQAVVVPMDAGWSDLGSWAAIQDIGDKDADGNVVKGDVYTHGMRNSMVLGESRLVAAVGLEDVIVVETADAVLAADRNKVQDVKALVERLETDDRYEQKNHRRVHRPWGWYETVDFGPRFQVKRLTVNPGAALSLQLHHHRAEHWVVVSGTAKVTKGNEEFTLRENESAYIEIGERHRLENPGDTPLRIIEVQTGSYLGEDDIERFDDRYNRHK